MCYASQSVYNSISYSSVSPRVLAEQVLNIFKAYPSLLVDHSRDIVEFLTNLRIPKAGGEEVYLHLVGVAKMLVHLF